MSYLDCFSNIIGISKRDCDCFATSGEESLSGLYVDDLVELADVFDIIDCQNGDDVSEVIENSIDQANREFMADFNINVLNRFKPRRQPFIGQIGKATYKNNLRLLNGKIAGIRIYCNNIKTGMMKINKIGGVFSNTGTVDLYIFNNLDELVDEITINTVAGRQTFTDVSLELPLSHNGVDNIEYYIYYDVDVLNQPKDNEIKCGTCGAFKPRFNLRMPYFSGNHGEQYNWSNWVMVGGLYSDPQDTWMTYCEKVYTTTNLMYGLTLQAELSCDTNQIVCNDDMDYQKNPIDHAIAHAIRYKAAMIILDKILRSGMINRLTLLNREEKEKQLQELNTKYWNIVTYIIDNIPESDCYACKPRYEMAVRGIKA